MKTTIRILLTGLFLCSSFVLSAQVDDDMSVGEVLYEEAENVDTGTISSPLGITRYRLGEGVTLSSKTDSYRINISGFIQSTFEATHYNNVDDDFKQYDKTYQRWRLRRARLRLNGAAWGGRVRYRIGIDMVKGSESADEGTGATLSDAYIQWRPKGGRYYVITFGQKFSPTDNKESFMSSLSSEFVEKSKLTSLFATNREVGLFGEASFKLGTRQYIRPAIAITDGSGSISSGPRYGGIKVGGRLNYLPFGTFRLYGDSRFGDLAYEMRPKLIVGAAYSYATKNADRRGGDGGGPYAYKRTDDKDPLYKYDMVYPDYRKFSADFLFKYKGISIFGEYVKSWSSIPNGIGYRVAFGTETLASTFNQTLDMPGEDGDINAYIRNRMALGSGFNLQASYMFRSLWDIAFRYTQLNPDTYSYMQSTTYYNRNKWYAASVTKWLTKSYSTKIQLSYAGTKPEGFGRIVQHNDAKFTGWENHIWLMFQLAF